MANEDSRKNSVLGTALKVAATGGAIYAGGRSAIKYKDLLGQTNLGKAVKSGIDEMADGNLKTNLNKIRGKAGEMQDNILQKNFDKSVAKHNKIVGKHDMKLTDEYTDFLHEGYKSSSSASERRDFTNTVKKSNAGLSVLDKEEQEILIGNSNMVSNAYESTAKATEQATK